MTMGMDGLDNRLSTLEGEFGERLERLWKAS